MQAGQRLGRVASVSALVRRYQCCFLSSESSNAFRITWRGGRQACLGMTTTRHGSCPRRSRWAPLGILTGINSTHSLVRACRRYPKIPFPEPSYSFIYEERWYFEKGFPYLMFPLVILSVCSSATWFLQKIVNLQRFGGSIRTCCSLHERLGRCDRFQSFEIGVCSCAVCMIELSCTATR